MSEQINKTVLLELAKRWETDAIAPACQDGSPEAKSSNDVKKGIREGKRECADGIRLLVRLL